MLPFLRTALLKRGTTLVPRTRPIARRTYATELHAKKADSDMPWLIGSAAFTIPAVVYLLSENFSQGHDAHAKHTEKIQAAIPKSTEGKTLSEAASSASGKASEVAETAKEKYNGISSTVVEPSGEAEIGDSGVDVYDTARNTASDVTEKAKESASDLTEKAKETASALTASDLTEKARETASVLMERTKDTASRVVEQVKETAEDVKDKVTPDDPEAPEAKNHPRLAAERETLEENRKPADRDVTPARTGSAAAKDPTSTNYQSGKQEGLSNTTTWHAELHGGRGKEISRKAEGVHDTAKVKGTVDPKSEGS